MKRLLAMAFLATLVAVGGILFAPDSVSTLAHGSEEGDHQEDNVMYIYHAQPGDSYTLIARKAVQTYGLKHNVALSEAAILYAESNLTIHSGSPQLEIGQRVEVAEITVAGWVEKAQKLTEGELANWQYYTQFANFNTDSVGQES